MSKLAELISQMEGFNVPGSLPNRQDNPGDLRHAPGETHPADAPNSVGSFDSPDAGWAALERQLALYAERGLTLQQAIYDFAPPTENDSGHYLDFVCTGLGCTSDTLVSDALRL
jgi:hypothetical protein